MDLEKMLYDAAPETDKDLASLNATVLAELRNTSLSPVPAFSNTWAEIMRLYLASLVKHPLPVATISTAMLYLIALQATRPLGLDSWLLQQASTLILR